MGIEELLTGYIVPVNRTVSWGQMDAFQHVNNTVYFRWFEDARIAFFDAVGWRQQDGAAGPILARTSCVFRSAVLFPDTITVASQLSDLGEDRLSMHYRIVSHRQRQVVAEGEGRVISYDYTAGAKAPLPPAVRDAMLALPGWRA